jgi:TRAP-type mannitol/chloroaromatic compound transport system substrate-binding protein
VLDACLNASAETVAETAAANEDFRRIHDSINTFRRDQYLWWQVAEYSYDTFMIRSRTRF